MRASIYIVILVATLSAGCAAQRGVASAASRRPNIIVIVADDLGYADIGAQNISKDVRTPNIDSIAANGVRFTNGYVSCPVCSPTRAGLLTGRYQQRFGHEFNPPPPPAAGFGLDKSQITLPQLLRERGYATGMVGKWHLGMVEGFRPWERGFDEYYGFLHGMHDYFDPTNAPQKRDDPVLRATAARAGAGGFSKVDEKEYLTDAFSREAVAFIERHRDQPFFLYLPFNAVHAPMQVPAKYLERFKDVSDEKRRTMLAMLSAMDDGVGAVLTKVREHGLENNTLVFFISDNGGPTKSNGSRNDPFSGFKTDLLEGGIREPFFVQWKTHIPAGKTIDHAVIQLDIFPTACAAAGATVPADRPMDGVNLLPVAQGKTDSAPHEYLYWRLGQQWAIRDSRYKLLFRNGGAKLFDLQTDLKEEHDLSAQNPEVLKRLRSAYDRWDAQMISKPRSRRPATSAGES